MFNYQYQNLAMLCSDILKVEQGLKTTIHMDSARFRQVVCEALVYLRKTHPSVGVYGVSLLYHVSASILDCLVLSAKMKCDKEDIAFQTQNRQNLERSVEHYQIRERDYSFFHGLKGSALPDWPGLPDLVKQLILDLCAIQYTIEHSSLSGSHVTSRTRYMDADIMFDDED